MKFIRFIPLLFLIIPLGFNECYKYKPLSVGEYNEIVVFTDSLDWERTKGTLSEVFEREIVTPQYENIFYLRYIPMIDFEKFKERRNIILITSLESKGTGAEMIKRMLSQPIVEGVKEGKYYIFQRKNEWARKQLVLLLISKDIETLINTLKENAESIFNLIDQDVNRRMKDSMYRGRENKKLSRKLFTKYGFGIKIQKDYIIAREDSANNFIWLRRWRPDRMIFLHWFDAKDGKIISKDWFINLRDKLTINYMDSSRINPNKIWFEKENFLGREALKVKGFWEIPSKVLGGPFISYVFYDPPTQRIYIIDISVFNPGDIKEPYLRQLSIIAHTFSVKPSDFY